MIKNHKVGEINMNFNAALKMRVQQRQKYLEDPNFEKLSDILTESDNYKERRDNHIFLYLLQGKAYDEKIRLNGLSVSKIEDTFLEKYHRYGINWDGIRQYYKERLESIHEGQWYDNDDSDVKAIINILETYKDKIGKRYATF